MIKKLTKEHVGSKRIKFEQYRRIDIQHILWKTNPQNCGVYWLMRNNKIVYIGFSENLKKRIRTHSSYNPNNKKHWNKCEYAIIGNSDLSRAIETAMIMRFKPEYNNPVTYKSHINMNNPQKSFNSYKNYIKSKMKSENEYLSELMVNRNKNQTEIKNVLTIIRKLKKHMDMSYTEFLINHKKKVQGRPHKLYK